MNSMIVYFVISAIVPGYCQGLSDTFVLKEWNLFQWKFGKNYITPFESRRRSNIFKENLLKIEAHNVLFRGGKETYEQGITEFSDQTADEFMQYVNRYTFNPQEYGKYWDMENLSLSAPLSLDWRNYDVVREVKHQGQCGSCWSFSATGALEGQAALRRKLNITLSEQNLIDCARLPYNSYGCKGGNMLGAFKYVKRHGIDSECNYSYQAQQGRCKQKKSVLSIRGYNLIRRGEANLKKAVASIGPISVAIEATSNLQHYRSGVFHDKECKHKRLNHAVLVIGYGNELGQDYWLIKNSWGPKWGESGYFKLVRNKGDNCYVSTYASYPKV
ncbi:hypothetical protein HHI36_004894 [Cryptolaemus montrouzieri]|uniref:Cathepsin L n=1 Tax=Cryptolaemus montrouzieri TaxID=559131 RepID=A0ABD2NSJ7_9CUCU